MIDQPQSLQDEQSRLMPLQVVKRDTEVTSATPLQHQTAQLMKTLADQETGMTYQKAAETTWSLLKTAIALLFHLTITGFALVVWLWGIGFQSGHYFREWIEVKSPSVSEIVCAVLRAIAFPFVSIYQWASAFVRESLGWEVQFNSLKSDPDIAPPDSSLSDDPKDVMSADNTAAAKAANAAGDEATNVF